MDETKDGAVKLDIIPKIKLKIDDNESNIQNEDNLYNNNIQKECKNKIENNYEESNTNMIDIR